MKNNIAPRVRDFSSGPTADFDAILKGALANYREDVALSPGMRSLGPKEFRALHDALVRAGQIESESGGFDFGDEYVENVNGVLHWSPRPNPKG